LDKISFIDLNPVGDNFLEDVWQGLEKQPKQLLPKYFYDLKGSQLFDQICNLEEYYPTKTEISILDDFSDEIDQLLEPQTALIEFGSGSSTKIRRLLDQSSKIRAYLPIDISKTHLRQAAERINQAYPKLAVTAICADYTNIDKFPKIAGQDSLTRAVFFPGSTIGNLQRNEAIGLLKNTHHWIGQDGILIIGIDLIKDEATLIKAYDDSKGVTAAFNINILERINRELNGSFNLENFRHEARFNRQEARIEMHLVSKLAHDVQVSDRSFFFEEGESIHTECSHKFHIKDFAEMARQAKFRLIHSFTDGLDRFAVCMLKAEA